MPRQVAAANGIVNPYGAGDVRLDSTPYVNYVLKQQAHEQARDEALDKWYTDMEKNVTPTGMRTIDIPVLLEGKKQAQEFYLKNKKAIKNPDLDNGKSLVEYSKLHNNNLGTVRASQNEYAGGQKLAAVSADPAKSNLFNQDVFGMLDANNKPINAPDFVSTNDILNHDLFHAKPLSPTEFIARQKWYGSAAGKPDEERIFTGKNEQDDLKDNYKVVKKYTPQDLQNVGELAGSDFSNPNVQATYTHPSPEQMVALTAAGKKAYGSDWIPDTPEKVYKALAIAQVLGESEKQESVVNQERKNARDLNEWYAKQAKKEADKKVQRRDAQELKELGTEAFVEKRTKEILGSGGKTQYVVKDNKVVDSLKLLVCRKILATEN